MESYGNLLKTAREQRNIDIQTAARETSIPAYSIEALEMEQSEKFPGEAYFVGFLRNYAEYLGLDHAYLYSLFHAKMVQTSPVPEKLLKREKSRLVVPFIIFGVVLVLGGLGYIFKDFILSKLTKPEASNPLETSAQGGAVYRLTSIPLKKRVYVGDSIIVPAADTGTADDITIDVSNTLSVLALKTPAGEHFVELGEEIELDVDGTGGSDIIVFLSDISVTDATRGAEISVLLKNNQSVADVGNEAVSLGRGSVVSSVILDDNRAYPFTVRIAFRDLCVFRYQADNQERVEDLFSNGAIVTIQANNGVRLWISNDNAARMQVIAGNNNFDLAVDTTNRVIVRDIRWVRPSATMYQLAVLQVD
jgi:cytoskeletal protein RodZ